MCPDFYFFLEIGEGGRQLLRDDSLVTSHVKISLTTAYDYEIHAREIKCILHIMAMIYEKPNQWDRFRDESFLKPIHRTPESMPSVSSIVTRRSLVIVLSIVAI